MSFKYNRASILCLTMLFSPCTWPCSMIFLSSLLVTIQHHAYETAFITLINASANLPVIRLSFENAVKVFTTLKRAKRKAYKYLNGINYERVHTPCVVRYNQQAIIGDASAPGCTIMSPSVTESQYEA
jgi:hypothetical protein